MIIGIAGYRDLPKAEYAKDDACSFNDYAIKCLGVKTDNIKLLIDNDADEIAISQAFKTWLPSRVRATTSVYVHYSGYWLPAVDGQGLYLQPLGAHRDLIEKPAISQQEINGYLQLAKPKSVTIFLDSCYSGLKRTGRQDHAGWDAWVFNWTGGKTSEYGQPQAAAPVVRWCE